MRDQAMQQPRGLTERVPADSLNLLVELRV